MLPPDIPRCERQAVLALQRYEDVRFHGLNWKQLGYALPDGSLPLIIMLEHRIISRVFYEHGKGAK